MNTVNKILLPLLGIGIAVLAINIFIVYNTFDTDIKFLYSLLILLFFALIALGTFSSETFMQDITNKSKSFQEKVTIFLTLLGASFFLLPFLIAKVEHEPVMRLLTNVIGMWFLLIAYRLNTGICIRINQNIIIAGLFLILLTGMLANLVTGAYKPIVYTKWSILWGILIFLLVILMYLASRWLGNLQKKGR